MNIRAFIPGERFPAISITGKHCALNCRYCKGDFLENMYSATSPHQLYSIARNLYTKGARGLLVSGGYDTEGRLPVRPFLSTIRDIKRDFGLVISLHSGLVDKELASDLRSSGVDIVDFQLVIDPVIIKDIQGLNKKPEDYVRSLRLLAEHGPTYVAPHLPLGFRYGKIVMEKDAIDVLRDFDPYIVVFLILISKNLSAADWSSPKEMEILNLLKYTGNLGCEKAIGCMRPTDVKSDLDEVMIGNKFVDRIAVPHMRLIRKWNLELVESCCSVPGEFLDRFIDDSHRK